MRHWGKSRDFQPLDCGLPAAFMPDLTWAANTFPPDLSRVSSILDELIKERRSLCIKRWAMRGGIAAGILLAAFVVTVKVVPKPQPATIYQEEASNLYREGRIDEAIHVYQKALELNPEDSSIYLMPGIVYEDKKALEKAAFYKKGESLYPQKTDFYNARAMAYFQKGKLGKAATDVKEVLKIDPKKCPFPFSFRQYVRSRG